MDTPRSDGKTIRSARQDSQTIPKRATKTAGKRSRLATDKPDDLYAISGHSCELDHWEWRVRVQRHHRVIKRRFPTTTYGSREVALTEAKAYRDAVVNLFPALTNYQCTQMERADNTSGNIRRPPNGA